MPATQRSFNFRRHATLQRGDIGKAIAACLALDVLELVDPAAGATDDLLAATATVASETTILAAALESAGLTKLAAHGARKVTFTTAGGTPADAPATVDIVGEDVDGNELTETLALAQTAATVTSVGCYSAITSVTYPAADGTSATVAIGIADTFGLPSKVRTLAGGPNIVREVEDGTAPTAGTFEDSATSAPYGSYTPNTTPDGSADFGLVYEHDPS
jgi:hypothetical protein